MCCESFCSGVVYEILRNGSNLNLDIMRKRSGTCKIVGASELKDMRLVFKRSADDYAYLTLEKALEYSCPKVYQK